MLLLFIIRILTIPIDEVTKKIASKMTTIACCPSFRKVSLNIYDPCRINELKKFMIFEPQHKPKCLSATTIDLLQNPETNTGYRYGAKEVWNHLFSVSENVQYQTLMRGLKFSITVHICKFYVKNRNGYTTNPLLFKKLYRKSNHDDFKILTRFVYNTFLKLNISKYKIPEKTKKRLQEVQKIIRENVDKSIINFDFEPIFDKCFAILNCVGCEKCKVWGKVQIKGLLTAFRMLNGKSLACTQELVFFIQFMNKLTVSSLETQNYLARDNKMKK